MFLLVFFAFSITAATEMTAETGGKSDEVQTKQSSSKTAFCIPISSKRKLCGESAINFCRDNMTSLSCRDFYAREGLDEINLSPAAQKQQ